METVEQIIKRVLAESREHCRFKRAWIPAGWACVEIDSFSKDLAKRLETKREGGTNG